MAIAVLAAGQSRRFGPEDKLTVEFRGKPLGQHVCDALADLPAFHRWLIAANPRQACPQGFERLVNAEAKSGLGTSVALAAKAADRVGADALLIALADMPLVPSSHFAVLASRAAPDALLASHNGKSPSPPALFGRDHFAALAGLSGDDGARTLLASAVVVPCEPSILVDIDDPATLARLS